MSGDEEARLAELRRALYRPDATDEDVRRYVALRPESIARPMRERNGQRLGPPRSPSHRRMLSIGGAVLCASAAALAISVMRTADGGAMPAVPVTPLTAAVRATTVEIAADDGGVLGQRFTGRGSGSMTLITGGAPLEGGRMFVRLTSSGSAPATWIARGGAGRSSTQLFASGVSMPKNGEPDLTPSDYRGAPPSRLSVQAPEGTDWSMTVAFTR